MKSLKIENVPIPKNKKAAKKKPTAKETRLAVKPSRETVVEILPNGLSIGCLVRYYDEGWRCGHLEEVIKNTVWVRPIAAYKSQPGRRVMLGLDEVICDHLRAVL